MAARAVEVDRLRLHQTPHWPPGYDKLVAAIQADDLKTLTELMTQPWLLTAMNTGSLCTPLAVACQRPGDDTRMISLLLAHGADPNRGYIAGPLATTRPIDLVTKSNQPKKADVLLRHGALLTPADGIVELLAVATDVTTNEERPASRRRAPLSKSAPVARGRAGVEEFNKYLSVFRLTDDERRRNRDSRHQWLIATMEAGNRHTRLDAPPESHDVPKKLTQEQLACMIIPLREAGGNGVYVTESAIQKQLATLAADSNGMVLHTTFDTWLRAFLQHTDDVNFERVIAALMYEAGLPARLEFDAPQWTTTQVFRAHLEVIVKDAVGLRAADVGNTSDPYVQITIDDAKDQYKNHSWRTPVCEKTLSPNWNYTFTADFAVDPLENGGALVFDVLDHDLMSADDFLGRAFVRFSTMKNTENDVDHHIRHVPLTVRNSSDPNTCSGTLTFSYRYQSAAWHKLQARGAFFVTHVAERRQAANLERESLSRRLFRGCAMGDIQQVIGVLRQGITADSDIGYGVAPIVVATANGHQHIVRLLMDNGARDIKIMVPREWTKLSMHHFYTLAMTTTGGTSSSAPATPNPSAGVIMKFPPPPSATAPTTTAAATPTPAVTPSSGESKAVPFVSSSSLAASSIPMDGTLWVLTSVLGGVIPSQVMATTKIPVGSNLAAIATHFDALR